MLRKFVLLGVVAASFAAIPAFYERNPQAIEAMLRQVLPGAAPPPQRDAVRAAPRRETLAPTGRQVRIPADWRGHYMADFRLNGRTVHALVDTDATYVAINRSTAQHIGLRLSPDDFRYLVETANGRTRAAAASIDRLEVGRIDIENVQAMVLEDEALAGTLVGLSFLNRLSRFQMERGALLLEQ